MLSPTQVAVTERPGLLTLMIARPVNLTQGTDNSLLAIWCAVQSLITE